jgi:hypothetical protein
VVFVIGYFVLGEATDGSGYLTFFDCAAAGRVERKRSVAVKRTAYFIVQYFFIYKRKKGHEGLVHTVKKRDAKVWKKRVSEFKYLIFSFL